MPATRKRTAFKDTPPVPSCDNHPGIPAVHVTTSPLHQAISLCEACLRRVGDYMRDR